MRAWALPLLVAALVPAPPARAVDIRLSVPALQSTLQRQLFASPDGRYYLRGNAQQPCSVAVDNPQLSIASSRLFLHLHLAAHVGHPSGTRCLGVSFSEDADISMLPVGDGELIRFTDVRVEKLNGSNDFDFLLNPFVRHTVPQSLQLNAANLLGRLVSRSRDTTGYAMSVNGVQVRSVTVAADAVVLTLDGTLAIDQP